MPAGLGASDCELVGAGALAQPINALSSVVLALVGAVLLYGARRHGRARPLSAALGVALVAAGAGSFVYHGPQPAWAEWFHDLGIAAIPIAIAVAALAMLGGPWSRAQRGGLTAAGVAGVVLWAAPGAAGLVWAGCGAVAAGALVAVWRRRPPVTDPRLIVAAMPAAAAAMVLNVAGRTGGPWCRPESVFQPHAGWHVAVAVALALGALAVGPARPGERS